jgi:hypothetical protein
VLQTAAPGQEVVGDVQDMVALVVGLMPLEEMEFVTKPVRLGVSEPESLRA